MGNAKPKECCCSGRDGDCCRIGCFCCSIALKMPTTCCAGASKFLCCYAVSSFPCSDDYVSSMVLGYLFLSCLPECGCLVEPPSCNAMDRLTKDGAPTNQEVER